MKLFLSLALLASACAFAQAPAQPKAPKPTAPAPVVAAPTLPDLKVEIALAQRDLVAADSAMKQAVSSYNNANQSMQTLRKTITDKIAEAQKFCAAGETFEENALKCVAKPAEQAKK